MMNGIFHKNFFYMLKIAFFTTSAVFDAAIKIVNVFEKNVKI